MSEISRRRRHEVSPGALAGDRVGTAPTLSHLGVLRTGQGRPADAISYQAQSLAIL